jgi:DNA-binding transcriptional regulator YiaG
LRLEIQRSVCYQRRARRNSTVPWTADNIRRLRAQTGITQAQLAAWLGVTVKQVKHLENRRRNPSGPVERLLDILASQPNGQPAQVLSAARREPPAARRRVDDAMVWGG